MFIFKLLVPIFTLLVLALAAPVPSNQHVERDVDSAITGRLLARADDLSNYGHGLMARDVHYKRDLDELELRGLADLDEELIKRGKIWDTVKGWFGGNKNSSGSSQKPVKIKSNAAPSNFDINGQKVYGHVTTPQPNKAGPSRIARPSPGEVNVEKMKKANKGKGGGRMTIE